MNDRFKQRAAIYLLLLKDNKVLLSRRKNTGWMDGKYCFVSGHIEEDEPATLAMIREAKEEAGIFITEENLKFCHVMHRKSPPNYYVDFYFKCEKWEGEPKICEPEICDEMNWFDVNNLPENLIPEMGQGLKNSLDGINYSEFGWS